MAITQHNFDWAVTERDLVIFVPNFGRRDYLVATLERFATAVPTDRWITVVVNDGLHEDLSDLAERFNLAWFTFERNPAVERNGCMIRNYFIRRCRSRLLCTRDPEIFIEGEHFVESVLALPPGMVYRTGGMTELRDIDVQKVFNNPRTVPLNQLQPLRVWHTRRGISEGFHAGVTIETAQLVAMRGYDEDYAYAYGYEDWDMLHRLVAAGLKIQIDPRVWTYHVWHPRPKFWGRTLPSNARTFESKDPKQIVRNGEEWGEG